MFDVTNNAVVINYGSGPDPISAIAGYIASGYSNGSWNGTGIVSSFAAAAAATFGVGYADSADPGNPAGLAPGTIEVMYTLLGDANLDGKVNGADFDLMATNFNDAVTNGWDEGDFNYDGAVNGNDFVLMANNFNQAYVGGGSSQDAAALEAFATANGISLAVPEPVTGGMFACIAGAGLLRRRRQVRSIR
jgi:hypothetical protein